MSLKFLKTPPPHAVLLPDAQFFVRAIPVPDAQTAAEVAAQVELALETLAPFPLAQMYYGHCWRPGAKHALAYAAYRKRFNAASVETWPAADIVVPAFVTLLSPTARPATTALLTTPEGLTAIHWADTNGVPDTVIARTMPSVPEDGPQPSESEIQATRATLRNEILRALPGTTHLYEYELPALENAPAPVRADNTLAFTTPAAASAQTSQSAQPVAFNNEQLDALDVRDKGDLATRRANRRRDLILWRCFLGCFVLLGLCALIEIGAKGGRIWQEKRAEQVKLQAPGVAEIDRANVLASRIEDLSTKRLLPLEMIDLLRPKLPQSILFTRVIARTLNAIEIQAKTNSASDFSNYRNALSAQSNIEKVDVLNSGIRDGSTTFTLAITFKPGSVRAAEDEPPPKPPEPPAPVPGAPRVQQNEELPVAAAPAAAAPSIHDQIQQQIGTTQTPAPAQPAPGEQQPAPQPPPQQAQVEVQSAAPATEEPAQ